MKTGTSLIFLAKSKGSTLPSHALGVWHAVDVGVQVGNEMSIALLREEQISSAPGIRGCGPIPLRCNVILHMYMHMHMHMYVTCLHVHASHLEAVEFELTAISCKLVFLVG